MATLLLLDRPFSCWLPLSHAESVAIHPGLELVGLCDPIPDARRQASELYPSLPVYDDPNQLLKDLQPDLVYHLDSPAA